MFRCKHRLRFGGWSVKSKLLLVTALLISIALFLESVLSYKQYTRNFERESNARVQQIIEQVSLNIGTYLDDLIRLAQSPYRNNAVMKALEDTEQQSEAERLQKNWTIEDFLDEMLIIPRNDILRVTIMANGIYSSGRMSTFDYERTDYRSADWYKKAVASPDPVFIPAQLQQVGTGEKMRIFSIAEQLRSTQNTERVLGVIKVDANYKGIEDICSKVDIGREGGLLITDAGGAILYSSSMPIDRGKLLGAVAKLNAPTDTVRIDGNDYMLNMTRFSRVDWTIVAVNSVREMNAKALKTRDITLLIALLCSLAAILALYVLVQNFTRPLFAIVKLMKQIERGNLTVRFAERRGDEIGYLGTSFNALVAKVGDMLDSNARLIREVYEAKLLQKEAQLGALYNQIRPHFIFNTLNMISLLMKSGQPEKAIDQIHQLSSILRGLTARDKEVTVRKEMELLHSYLSIQSSRYDGRLDYSIDVDPELLPLLVPPLLFQPLVENAVIHGCETKRGKTTIRLTGRAEGGDLIFVTEDDGAGMDEAKLAEVRLALSLGEEHAALPSNPNDQQDRGSMPAGTGIGLLNVHQRIRMKYGAGYGLVVDSAPGRGTRVTMKLPNPLSGDEPGSGQYRGGMHNAEHSDCG